jgi:serine phosphatase RsbU (regulator of sigma subunit)
MQRTATDNLAVSLGLLLGPDGDGPTILTPVLDALAEAVTIRAPDDSLIYANRAALARMGMNTLAELRTADPKALMADYETTAADGGPLSLPDLPSVRLLRGEEPEPLLMRTVNRASGEEHWVVLKATAIRDPNGVVLAAVTIIEDVTVQHRASQRLQLLTHAAAILASSLDHQETLRNVAGLAVPQLADWCGVDLFDAEGRRQSVAVAHKESGKLELAERLREYDPEQLDPERGLGMLLRTGEPQLYPRITEEMLVGAAIDEEHLRLLRSVGMRSVLLVPLAVRERIIGALTLVSAESGREFDYEDLEFAAQLAERAALAVEHARLYTDRTYTAETLQASLRPGRLPRIPGWSLAAEYRPAAEIGGDFYEIWPVGEEWIAMIGDVTGKGVDAAALTALARHTAREASYADPRPAYVLSRIDAALKRRDALAVCTALCLRLNQAEVTIAAGGHPLPLRVHDGAVASVGEYGCILGALEAPNWPESTFTLRPGETLIAITDGVTDALDATGARFGADRLTHVLQAADQGSAEAICRAVTAALADYETVEQADDIAILALQHQGRAAVTAGSSTGEQGMGTGGFEPPTSRV